jgi:hypothetical protein
MQAGMKDPAVSLPEAMQGIESSQAAIGRSGMYWARTIGYWAFTLIISFEMAAGGLWDLLRIEYVRVVMTHLGYPLYVLFIIGVWKIPCAAILLSPRLLRLKEWAYAGAVFNYTGAAASHFLAGDGPNKWVAPLIFAVFTLASWALRPRARRLSQENSRPAVRTAGWLVPGVVFAVLLVASFLSLPKGPPPP